MERPRSIIVQSIVEARVLRIDATTPLPMPSAKTNVVAPSLSIDTWTWSPQSSSPRWLMERKPCSSIVTSLAMVLAIIR